MFRANASQNAENCISVGLNFKIFWRSTYPPNTQVSNAMAVDCLGENFSLAITSWNPMRYTLNYFVKRVLL